MVYEDSKKSAFGSLVKNIKFCAYKLPFEEKMLRNLEELNVTQQTTVAQWIDDLAITVGDESSRLIQVGNIFL